jgi:hypothetical protein
LTQVTDRRFSPPAVSLFASDEPLSSKQQETLENPLSLLAKLKQQIQGRPPFLQTISVVPLFAREEAVVNAAPRAPVLRNQQS